MAIFRDPSGESSSTQPVIIGVSSVGPASEVFAPVLVGGAPQITLQAVPSQGVALNQRGQLPISAPATAVPVYTSDPAPLFEGMVWLRSDLSKLSAVIAGAVVRVTLA